MTSEPLADPTPYLDHVVAALEAAGIQLGDHYWFGHDRGDTARRAVFDPSTSSIEALTPLWMDGAM